MDHPEELPATGLGPPHVREWIDKLAAAEDAIQALTDGKIDAVIDPRTAEPILLQHAQKALRESDIRFRLIMSRMNALVCDLDPNGLILYANDQAEAILGHSVKAITERNFSELLLGREAAGEHWFPVALSSRELTCEPLKARTRQDADRILEITTVIHPGNGSGERRAVTVYATDITEREQSAARLKRQFAHLMALRTIDNAITGTLDVRVILEIFLEQVLANLKADALAVYLLDPHTQTLAYAAGRGFHGAEITKSVFRIGEGSIGRVALHRKGIHIPDLRRASASFKNSWIMESERFLSYFSVPLIAKGKVMGALDIFNRSTFTPDEEWLEYLDAFAGQAAIAINDAALFEDIKKANAEITHAYEMTLEGWVKALDLRHKETEGHTKRVTETTLKLARAMGYAEADLAHVRRGALLHDIGKLAIPDSILLKPGPLTEDELVIMKKHPLYAYEWLHPISYLRPAIDIPHYHHEKWDGTGYPLGLAGENIPLSARIFALVDVWDALSFDRHYRKAWPPEQVKEYIKQQPGKHFDPQVVDAFFRLDQSSDADEIAISSEAWKFKT